MDHFYLALWACTIPLVPYALLRRKQELLAVAVVVFLALSINVLMMINRPNADWVRLDVGG